MFTDPHTPPQQLPQQPCKHQAQMVKAAVSNPRDCAPNQDSNSQAPSSSHAARYILTTLTLVQLHQLTTTNSSILMKVTLSLKHQPSAAVLVLCLQDGPSALRLCRSPTDTVNSVRHQFMVLNSRFKNPRACAAAAAADGSLLSEALQLMVLQHSCSPASLLETVGGWGAGVWVAKPTAAHHPVQQIDNTQQRDKQHEWRQMQAWQMQNRYS